MRNTAYCKTVFKLTLTLFCVIWASLSAADTRPLTLGVFPYVTAKQLRQLHEPLRARLQQTLNREVVMVTAPNFSQFIDRTHRRQYDFVLTAPHLGWLAESQDGYQHLAGTSHNVQGVFLTRMDSPINDLRDLKNKSITMAAPSSIIYQMAEKQLLDNGLIDGENITINVTRTHNNAMHAPSRQESDASLTGVLLWGKLGQQYKEKMRVFATTPKVPGFMFLARADLSATMRDRTKSSLLSFSIDPSSHEYFHRTGFNSFIAIDPMIRQSMEAYLNIGRDNGR